MFFQKRKTELETKKDAKPATLDSIEVLIALLMESIDERPGEWNVNNPGDGYIRHLPTSSVIILNLLSGRLSLGIKTSIYGCDYIDSEKDPRIIALKEGLLSLYEQKSQEAQVAKDNRISEGVDHALEMIQIERE